VIFSQGDHLPGFAAHLRAGREVTQAKRGQPVADQPPERRIPLFGAHDDPPSGGHQQDDERVERQQQPDLPGAQAPHRLPQFGQRDVAQGPPQQPGQRRVQERIEQDFARL